MAKLIRSIFRRSAPPVEIICSLDDEEYRRRCLLRSYLLSLNGPRRLASSSF